MIGAFSGGSDIAKNDLKDRALRMKQAEDIRKRIMKLAKRKTDRLSMSEFCRRNNLSPAFVSRVTQGRTTPRKATIDKLLAALKKENG